MQNTLSMRSMLYLGSWGMPPGKNKCNEIESRGNFKMIAILLAITMKYYYSLCTYPYKNNW